MAGPTLTSSGRTALSTMCRSCRHAKQRQTNLHRPLSSTATRKAENNSTPNAANKAASMFIRQLIQKDGMTSQPQQHRGPQAQPPSLVSNPRNNTSLSRPNTTRQPSVEIGSLLSGAKETAQTRTGSGIPANEPYHIHVYSHKHNTHITFTEPSRNAILSFSCGNIGLKKAQRSSFEAAYQLATYAMKKIAGAGWRLGGKKNATVHTRQMSIKDIQQSTTGGGIEVAMRGFGPGREAFQKALLGSEGSLIRPLIMRVTDSTRLKFGGARSRNVRRL